MDVLEAIAVDMQHLKLKKPLSENIGKHLLIQILSPQNDRSHQLKMLERAYLTMTEKEKKAETDLAEEGLRGLPDISNQIPEEGVVNWWE